MSGKKSHFHVFPQSALNQRFCCRDSMFIAALYFSLGLVPGFALAEQTMPADLVVDLGITGGPVRHPAAGFLLSFSGDAPPDDFVVPLKPQMFRLRTTSAMERAAALNAKIMVLVSDMYAAAFLGSYADRACKWPGDDGDWTAWEKHCVELARDIERRKLSVVWDIWNEPSIDIFWKRGASQFYETWRRGVESIRSVDPDAVITGPSFHAYDREALSAFLRYARSRDVIPNILNWHELSRARDIVDHVGDARDTMKRLGIKIDRIMIPEVVAADRQFQPGHAVSVIAAIHRANVEAACHACWGENSSELDPTKNPVNNCENNSLDGLLGFEDKRPRPVWWVYRAYGDMSGDLAAVKGVAPFIDGVAAKNVARRCATILLGRCEEDLTKPARDIVVEVRSVSSLQDTTRRSLRGPLRVVARSVPNQGAVRMDEPRVVTDEMVPVRKNTIRFTLQRAEADHAFWIAITHADERHSLEAPVVGHASNVDDSLLAAAEPSAFVFRGRSSIETRLKRFFPVTLEAWIKAEPNEKDVFVLGSSSAKYQGIGLGINNGHLRAQYISGDIGSPAQVAADEWAHVAAVYDLHVTRLYLNGKHVAEGPPNKKKDDDAPLFVVGDVGKDYSGHHFQGRIRSVRISRGARYTTEFTPEVRFEKDLPGSPTPAVLIYDAAMTKPRQVVDLSGENNHGLLIGVEIAPLD